MKVLIVSLILCASARADTRIFGGINADYGEFPHVVSIHCSHMFRCSGTIIDREWILTSAECLWKYTGQEYVCHVYLGGILIDGSGAGTIDARVRTIIPHPDYDSRNSLYHFNIGLIRLYEPIEFNPNISIAYLPEDPFVKDGTKGDLAGWGGISDKKTKVLQWAQMITMPIDHCIISVGGNNELGLGQICTYAFPAASACWYDLGGALVDRNATKGITILGVLAYAGCLNQTHPTVYTNPSYYIDWISSITGLVLP